MRDSRCVSLLLSREEGSPPLNCWRCSNAAQKAVCFLCHKGTLLAHSQTRCPPGLSGPYPESCVPSGWPPVCTVAWRCCYPGVEHCTSFCGTLWSSWLISPTCLGPSEHTHLMYHPLLPNLNCQQTCQREVCAIVPIINKEPSKFSAQEMLSLKLVDICSLHVKMMRVSPYWTSQKELVDPN